MYTSTYRPCVCVSPPRREVWGQDGPNRTIARRRRVYDFTHTFFRFIGYVKPLCVCCTSSVQVTHNVHLYSTSSVHSAGVVA